MGRGVGFLRAHTDFSVHPFLVSRLLPGAGAVWAACPGLGEHCEHGVWERPPSPPSVSPARDPKNRAFPRGAEFSEEKETPVKFMLLLLFGGGR